MDRPPHAGLVTPDGLSALCFRGGHWPCGACNNRSGYHLSDPELSIDDLAFDRAKCREYLQGTLGLSPRPALIEAAARFDNHGSRVALDIGCGPGREVVALLGLGFRVVALDPYAEMIELTKNAVRSECPHPNPKLELHLTTLERFAPCLPNAMFDLVHAGFVFPFIAGRDFPEAFGHTVRSMREGALLVAQFFGADDQFIREARAGEMTSHDRASLSTLLDGFEILRYEEVNRAGNVGRGVAKWWHVHHVTAMKRTGKGSP